MLNSTSSESYLTWGLPEENYYKLLVVAINIGAQHILEWAIFQEYGHMALLQLNRDQRSYIYHQTRKAVIREENRAKRSGVTYGGIQ